MKRRRFRKISETITLNMALWLFALTMLGTLASYWHINNIVTTITWNNLEKYITVRGERESQVFALAERNQQALTKRILEDLRTKKGTAYQFNELFTKFSDGAIRDRVDISNLQHPSFFIPADFKLTETDKDTALRFYDFLDKECFLSLSTFSTCWIADNKGMLGVFMKSETGYATTMPANFKNMEQGWMTIISPENNPSRASRWTKTYLDPNLNSWCVTLATPIYEEGRFIGAIGNDIFIGKVFERILNKNLEGTKSFILNSEGSVVAHPDLQDKINNAGGNLNVSSVSESMSILSASYALAKKNLEFRDKEVTSGVYDLNSHYLAAITTLEGPDWYLVTIYPKSIISAAALDAAKYIMFFGIITLILELILLMNLISAKLGNPMGQLVRAVQKIGAGDLKSRVDCPTNDEFGLLGSAFNEMTYNLEMSLNEKEKAIALANQANRVKSDFVSNMSHEMRTPLNGILGLTHFLNETTLSDEQKKYANLIEQSGRNLLQIVEQVLDVAKLDEKKFSLEKVPFELTKLLGEVRDFNLYLAKEKGLPLDFRNNVSYTGTLNGDYARLKQTLCNLISNSIKFSDVGVVTIEVDEVEGSWPGRRLRFSVKDQGIGIADEIKDRLFQPFYQGDNSSARRYGGTGLGLHIAKSFVGLMGGVIGVNSHEGEGSHFWFEVTLDDATTPVINLGEAKLGVDAHQPMLPVLVVEDNPINQVFTQTFLKKLNIESVLAENGQIAVDMFQENKFSMILMDCQMPIMDGYEASRMIRKMEKHHTIPILALTANSEPNAREMCLESGMDDLISKPVKVSVFKEKLDHWMHKKQARVS